MDVVLELLGEVLFGFFFEVLPEAKYSSNSDPFRNHYRITPDPGDDA